MEPEEHQRAVDAAVREAKQALQQAVAAVDLREQQLLAERTERDSPAVMTTEAELMRALGATLHTLTDSYEWIVKESQIQERVRLRRWLQRRRLAKLARSMSATADELVAITRSH